MATPDAILSARRGLGAAVALERARLRATWPARLGLTASTVLGVGFAGAAVIVRMSSTSDVPVGSMLATAARALMWAAALPMAFAAASDWRAKDRADGVTTLAAARGISEGGVAQARFFAAVLETGRALAVPLVGLALVHAVLAWSARGLAVRLFAALLGALLALIVGATLGGVGAACASLARAAGRRTFASVVLVPWLVAGFLGHVGWSLPGALDAVLSFAFSALPGRS